MFVDYCIIQFFLNLVFTIHFSAPPSPLTLSNNSGVPASTVSSIGSESMDHNRPIHSTSTLPHSGVHHTSSHHHHHTLPHHHSSRSSPPLPPPPLPEEDQHPRFGQPASSSQGLAIVSDEPDLPGWVPKNYIEKGTSFCGVFLTGVFIFIFMLNFL